MHPYQVNLIVLWQTPWSLDNRDFSKSISVWYCNSPLGILSFYVDCKLFSEYHNCVRSVDSSITEPFLTREMLKLSINVQVSGHLQN